MRRRALVLLLAFLLPACGGRNPIPEVDLQVSVHVGAERVHPGEAFPLTVTRIWRKDIEPSPWDDGMLSPLVVRAEGTARTEDELRVRERLYFRAYAFSLASVKIPPVLLVGRSIGGSGRVLARSEPIALTVEPVLEAAAPGEAELPDVPPAPGRSRSPLLVLLLTVLAVLAGAALVARRRRARVVEPGAGAEERRAALRALLERGQEDPVGTVLAADAHARALLAGVSGQSLASLAREEILPLLPAAWQRDAAVVLKTAERVKFAGIRPDEAELEAYVTSARSLLRLLSEGPA